VSEELPDTSPSLFTYAFKLARVSGVSLLSFTNKALAGKGLVWLTRQWLCSWNCFTRLRTTRLVSTRRFVNAAWKPASLEE
jgi:hypothetical protein